MKILKSHEYVEVLKSVSCKSSEYEMMNSLLDFLSTFYFYYEDNKEGKNELTWSNKKIKDGIIHDQLFIILDPIKEKPVNHQLYLDKKGNFLSLVLYTSTWRELYTEIMKSMNPKETPLIEIKYKDKTNVVNPKFALEFIKNYVIIHSLNPVMMFRIIGEGEKVE